MVQFLEKREPRDYSFPEIMGSAILRVEATQTQQGVQRSLNPLILITIYSGTAYKLSNSKSNKPDYL
jgi:hypothetical protein